MAVRKPLVLIGGAVQELPAADSLFGKAADADLFDGLDSSRLVATLTAESVLTGGGTISYSASNELKWTSRFIVIGNGRGPHHGTAGYFDINCPAAGVVVTGVGGAGNATVTANGIPIPAWGSLYYAMPVGGGSAHSDANLRIVGYTANFQVPDNWVLLAANNADGNYVRVTLGIILKPGQSYNTTANSSANVPLAAAASKLATPRNINGVPFDGTSDITIDAPSSSGVSRSKSYFFAGM